MQPFLILADSNTLIVLGAIWGLMSLIFLCFVATFLKQYKRCPSNRALVVFGKVGPQGKGFRVVHGGALFVWPLIQDFMFLELDPFAVEVEPMLLTGSDGESVCASATAHISINSASDALHLAAIHLVGLSKDEIKTIAAEIFRDALRQTALKVTADQLLASQSQTISEWQIASETALEKVGLKIIHANLTIRLNGSNEPASTKHILLGETR